jgi:hypothetical protein
MGRLNWEKAIVSSTMRGEMIYQGIHRNLKQISIVVCISTSEEHMTLFFVGSQVNDPVGRKLKTEGFRIGLGLILKRRNKSDMNFEHFTEYLSTFLLRYIYELWSNEEFADKEAVLLMDNCFIYTRSKTLQMFADHQMKVITFHIGMIHIQGVRPGVCIERPGWCMLISIWPYDSMDWANKYRLS